MNKKTVNGISFAILSIGIIGVLARFFGAYMYHNGAYLSLFEDDFYYYVLIAKNIAFNGQSTFDSFTQTNGYHPLWLLVTTLIAFLFQGVESPFFIVVALIACLSSVMSFHLLSKIGKHTTNDSPYIPLFAALITLSINRMNTTGMEVILTVPLALLWGYFLLKNPNIKNWNAKTAVLFGIFSSLVILSRLDTIWLVFSASIVLLYQMKVDKKFYSKTVLWGIVGLTPLLIYLFVNVVTFNSFLPVSGMAKSLTKLGFVFEIAPLEYSLFKNEGISSKLSSFLIVVGLLIWFLTFKKQNVQSRWIVGVFLLFPYLFLLSNGFRSPWVSLWWWYQYPNYIGAFFSLCLMLSIPLPTLEKFQDKLRTPSLIALASFGLFYAMYSAFTYNKDVFINSTEQLAIIQKTSIYQEAKRMKQFVDSSSLSGRFAMGDRAGLSAFILQKSVFQVEGLVADKALIESIKKEENLSEVLKKYNIDYYIISIGNRLEMPTDSSMKAFEPHFEQAGIYSKKMVGVFTNPIYTSEVGTSPKDSLFTYIFDLRISN